MPNLISMKLNRKEIEERNKLDTAVPEPTGPEYPWGLTIRLDKACVEKLDVRFSDFKIGDTLDLSAKCTIKGLQQSQGGGYEDKSVELQITDMALQQGFEGEEDASLGWDDSDREVDRKLKRRGY